MRLADPATPFEPAPLPTAMITSSDSQLLSRLVSDGAVELELIVATELGDEPVLVHDVVGELAGGALPDEIVFAATHLDSWDLASGASESCTGITFLQTRIRICSTIHARL